MERPKSHELAVLKRAFARAVDMAGGTARMADALGVTPGQVSKWKSLDYCERLPLDLANRVDTAAGYPVMLEAQADLAGYSLRREDVERSAMPLCTLAGMVAADSGRALQTVLEANSDMTISVREMNCIEAEAKTVIANVNRMLEAARAKHEAGR